MKQYVMTNRDGTKIIVNVNAQELKIVTLDLLEILILVNVKETKKQQN